MPVRWHFYAGAALLLVAALLVAALHALPPLTEPAALYAFLAGLTLFAQGIAYWYLPSFAKRAVVLRPLAAIAGPTLYPIALLGELAGFGLVRDVATALALAHFALTALASAWLGPRWRSGVPFWKAEGPHRHDDRAAAFVLALSLLSMLALAALLALVPEGERALAIGWPASLLLFAVGALAHLLPRSRARGAWPVVVAAAALVGALGAWWIVLTEPSGRAASPIATALLLAFPIAAVAIVPPGGAKKPGPRLKEAAPSLALGLAVLALALLLWSALRLRGETPPPAVALLVALCLSYVGLTTLTLPVLFNQKPAARYLPLVLVFALVSALLSWIALATPGRIVLTSLILAWLAALWPLRKPRRECPPDEPGPEAS